MPFELRIALRYLTARRKQAFISVISAISILGVAVGVMAVLISLGLMTGLQAEVRSRILGATAHVSLFPSRSESFEDYREIVRRVRKLPRVLGSAPALYGKCVLSSTTSSQLATIKGILPSDEETVTELASQADPGAMAALASPGAGLAPILLGRDLAAALSVGAGDVVTVTAPQGRLSPDGRASPGRPLQTGRDGAERSLRVRLQLGVPAPVRSAAALRGRRPRDPRRGPRRRHVRGEGDRALPAQGSGRGLHRARTGST